MCMGSLHKKAPFLWTFSVEGLTPFPRPPSTNFMYNFFQCGIFFKKHLMVMSVFTAVDYWPNCTWRSPVLSLFPSIYIKLSNLSIWVSGPTTDFSQHRPNFSFGFIARSCRIGLLSHWKFYNSNHFSHWLIQTK